MSTIFDDVKAIVAGFSSKIAAKVRDAELAAAGIPENAIAEARTNVEFLKKELQDPLVELDKEAVEHIINVQAGSFLEEMADLYGGQALSELPTNVFEFLGDTFKALPSLIGALVEGALNFGFEQLGGILRQKARALALYADIVMRFEELVMLAVTRAMAIKLLKELEKIDSYLATIQKMSQGMVRATGAINRIYDIIPRSKEYGDSTIFRRAVERIDNAAKNLTIAEGLWVEYDKAHPEYISASIESLKQAKLFLPCGREYEDILNNINEALDGLKQLSGSFSKLTSIMAKMAQSYEKAQWYAYLIQTAQVNLRLGLRIIKKTGIQDMTLRLSRELAKRAASLDKFSKSPKNTELEISQRCVLEKIWIDQMILQLEILQGFYEGLQSDGSDRYNSIKEALESWFFLDLGYAKFNELLDASSRMIAFRQMSSRNTGYVAEMAMAVDVIVHELRMEIQKIMAAIQSNIPIDPQIDQISNVIAQIFSWAGIPNPFESIASASAAIDLIRSASFKSGGTTPTPGIAGDLDEQLDPNKFRRPYFRRQSHPIVRRELAQVRREDAEVLISSVRMAVENVQKAEEIDRFIYTIRRERILNMKHE